MEGNNHEKGKKGKDTEAMEVQHPVLCSDQLVPLEGQQNGRRSQNLPLMLPLTTDIWIQMFPLTSSH